MILNKTKGKVALLVSAVTVLMSACTAGFEGANDPREKANAEILGRDNYNVASFMANLQNASFPEQENAAQMTYDLIGRYVGRYYTYTVGGWNGKSVASGVIEANSDNLVRYYNPLGIYKTTVEWGDSRMAADIDSYMNGYSDPRLSKFFKPATTQTVRDYVGCLAGANIGNKDIATGLYSAGNFTATSGDPYLTAAEMYFCRAEGVLAGWNMGGRSVLDYYEAGVKASFEQWGAGDATSYLTSTATPSPYSDATGGYGMSLTAPSTITVAWDNNATTAQQLERIITQKWIALYPNGQEAWSEIRRTGYPQIFDIQTSKNGYTSLKTPNRIPFDSEEKVNNATNYAAGVALLGGADNYATRLWWDVN